MSATLTAPPRPEIGAGRPTAHATSRSTYDRRRVGVLAGLVVAVFALTVVLGRAGAGADLADPVAGHVVVAPGETLWDVAVDTAPDGVDPRRQLAALRELNGFDGGHLDAWTVVLLPAR